VRDSVPAAWPHISEAIQTGKRERGNEEAAEPRKRGNSRGQKAPSPTPAGKPGLHLNIGGIGAMDVEEKRAMGKSESAQRQAELDKHRGICSEVLPFLFVGAEMVARDKELMQKHGITHVVNCAGTVLENFHPESFKYLKMYLYDAKTEDLGCLFYEVIDFIEEAKAANGKVFIHCHQGVSRSCSCVISYLINKEGKTYEQGFDQVKARRGICNPNAGFICQLLEFQQRNRDPMSKPRGFRISKHSTFPDSSFCARSVAPGAGTPKQDECIVIHTPTRLFLWRGAASDAATLASAEEQVRRLQLFEGAPGGAVEHLEPGQEPMAFWKAADECGLTVPPGATGSPGREDRQAVAAPVDVYNLEAQRRALAEEDEANRTTFQRGNRPVPGGGDGSMTQRGQPTQSEFVAPPPTGFELLKMNLPPDEHQEPMSSRQRSAGETVEPVKEKEEKEEEAKLFTYPDYEELEMFDSDDLQPDMCVVLLPNKRPVKCLYVWVGEEFLEDEGDDKQDEVASEFLSKQGLPSNTKVEFETQDEESDTFWDFFVNG